MNNLLKVVAQQRHGRGSNPRPLDRKSDVLPLSHRAFKVCIRIMMRMQTDLHHKSDNNDYNSNAIL